MSSLVQRLLLPPPGPYRAPDLREHSNVRAVFIALALLIDLLILVTCKDAPLIRKSALKVFEATNLTLLNLDLALTLFVIRRGIRGSEAALFVCVALEAIAGSVWIQMTGTLSSYFLAGIPLMVGAYRIGVGYRVGAWFAAWAVACQLIAFTLESLSIIPSASFFVVSSSPIYGTGALRFVILLSIESGTFVAFAASNFGHNVWSEKDLALSAAREQLRRALAEGRPGELVGRVIAEKYLLTDFLGRGGMGDVYRGTRQADGLATAIKILHFHLAAEPVSLGRFRREFEAARRLVGARVPEVLEEGLTEEGLRYFAMELLRGEDLASLLKRRDRLSLDEIQNLAGELAEVLDVVHAAGIVHRDVKPSNVFLSEAPDPTGRRVHLLDFGIAALCNDAGHPGLTMAGAVVGTPGYVAPEQLSREYGEVGPPTDVFAMAAVIYRALTGRPAFPVAGSMHDSFAALRIIPRAPSSLVPELSPDVDAVFLVALAKTTADRCAKASLFVSHLRAAVRGELPEHVRAHAQTLTMDVHDGPTTTRPIVDAPELLEVRTDSGALRTRGGSE